MTTALQVKAVEIAVAAPLRTTLTYRVPTQLHGVLTVGCRVRVPLGRREAVGFVLGEADAGAEGLKEVRELLDPQPLFHPAQAGFYRRAAEYYAHPIGEVVRTALPAGLSGRGKAPVILRDRRYSPTTSTELPVGPRQQDLLTFVRERGEAFLSELRQLFPNPHPVLQRLVELDLVAVAEVERQRDPFADTPVPIHRPVTLNNAQRDALGQIVAGLQGEPRFAPFLLHGVTGSGKTEVYLRAIAAAVEAGRRALVLVPEISLTPQLVGRFRSWFQHSPVRLAVLHSGLSDGERYDAWRRVACGEADVVIGARSAVFAPLPDLALVIVDEEHDASYKQSEGLRYNARDLALLRGQMEKAVVVLGSATPALTTYQRARDGLLTLLELPERTADRPLPRVELVDMTAAGEGEELLSGRLQEALQETFAAGDQSLLLLNRRGYAPFVLCQECGATQRCPNCAITLTFSRSERRLRCHYCDLHKTPPETCEACGGRQIMPEGAGTERLEEAVRSLLPDARVARMDRDTTGRKGAHARLVEQMANRQTDVLIGTQMIAKGHDFPAVTLVGVLNADTALNLPDFRSAERVFALLSQVAGRAGRGDRPGKVLIQTYDPEHAALEFVTRHDYQGFARLELEQRQALAYPPYGYLVNLVLAGNDQAMTTTAAERLAASLNRIDAAVEVLGPAPCLLQKLRGKFRMQVLLKAGERRSLRGVIDRLLAERKPVPSGVALTIDVDPLDMF